MAAEMEKEKSAILDVVSELVMLLDGDLKVIWSNAAVNREFNIEAARLEGRRCFEALHGLKRPCRVCPVVTAFRTNQPCVIDDFSSLGKRWRLRAYPLRDRDGHATSVVEIVTDITEQKLAEEALKRGEEKFRSLVETVGDWVWETDATGACTYASPRIRDLLGYEPEEVLGKRAFDFMASAERERVGRVFREAVRSRAPLKAFECTALHKSGREVVLETSGVPITDAEGNLLGYRGIDRDITARKRGEAVLHEGEKTYRSVIENIQDVFYRSDRAGRLLMASPSGARMFGYDRVDDMIGMSLDVFWPDAREREKILEQILATGGVKDFEAVLTRKDGSMFNAAFTTHFYYDDQGRFQGTEGIIRDITDRKRAEEALEKRILALTRPLDAVETIAFEDLFNPADLQQLQDLFADIWGVAALITRPDGTPVTRPSNFTYFCSDFIRRNEKGFRNCQISDATLGRHHPSGPIIRPCMSAGLWGGGSQHHHRRTPYRQLVDRSGPERGAERGTNHAVRPRDRRRRDRVPRGLPQSA